ncbi:hypothetical protein [Micromonospora chersina]|uniref:hypothetical protein n=1 Tax=Micromonospora chersina TaxID=47854 RepID=UPI003715E88E
MDHSGSTPPRTPGDLKQEILRVYNAVNQGIAGVGVSRQRVDLVGDRILILAKHQRVKSLAALDSAHREITREVDVALLDEGKRRLAQELKDKIGLAVRVVLKDYDPSTEIAATVVVLDAPLVLTETRRHP